ncbi:hypothetical protein Lser_V15G18909 [Lactuca serriola]
MEVTRLKEEMGRDLVLSRVESLALHRRIQRTEKEVTSLTILVIGLVIVPFGFMVEKFLRIVNP